MKTFDLFTLVAVTSSVAVRADDADADCTPAIADRCFKDFWAETLYSNKSLQDICSVADDKILCSKDIIDDGCEREDGRDNFDSWVSGLTAVTSFLCQRDSNLLNEFVKNVEPRGKCFNLDSFISCVETKTRVSHVADMLFVTMDAVECNWVMMSYAACGARVTSPECNHVKMIVDEVLQIFFQEVKCAQICAKAASSRKTYIPLLLLLAIGFSETLLMST